MIYFLFSGIKRLNESQQNDELLDSVPTKKNKKSKHKMNKNKQKS